MLSNPQLRMIHSTHESQTVWNQILPVNWRRGWDLNPRGPEDQQLSWPSFVNDLEVQRPSSQC